MQSNFTTHTKHKVFVYAVCEITITNDDPDEAKAIAGKLFGDDIASKSEMFSVHIERMEVGPLGEGES